MEIRKKKCVVALAGSPFQRPLHPRSCGADTSVAALLWAAGAAGLTCCVSLTDGCRPLLLYLPRLAFFIVTNLSAVLLSPVCGAAGVPS